MSKQRITKQDAMSKFQQYSLLDHKPETIGDYLRSADTGDMRMADQLFSAMYHEWEPLQKDVNKMAAALATLDFKAVAVAPDGGTPSDIAEQVAATVNAAMWHSSPQKAGRWSHTFQQLLGSLYHALCRGYNVHEIQWSYDPLQKLVYPAAYLPVMPEFFRWETQSGKEDRLLLYRSGTYAGEGEPFPADRFIVALNTQGPDHPMRNAIFRALVPWYGAAIWGVRWFMDYCQLFGLPLRTFHVEGEEEKKQLEEDLYSKQVLTDVVLVGDQSVEVQSAAQGAGLPQQALLDMAERACHKLILGQTLTSDTSKEGGSRAQAQVHAGVEAAEIMAVGEFVAGVLNAQLVPAIVRMNYGTANVPIPELRCSLPTAQATRDTVELFDGMINRLGMTVRRSDVYDRLGIQMPKPGDEVLGPIEEPAPGRDAISAAAAARYARRGHAYIQELGDAAERAAVAAYGQTVQPVLELLAQAAHDGATPGQLLDMLTAAKVDTQPLAEGQQAAILAGLGINPVKKTLGIEAANPYGCNKHGHKCQGQRHVKPERIKSKSGHTVEFGRLLDDHLNSDDKDRSDRWRDMEHAKNAIRYGTCKTQGGRLIFTHHFTTKQGKEYKILVVAVKKGRNTKTGKQWQVLTYHRFR